MSAQFPFFSVVINTYNSAKTIEKTLRSVFTQTFTNYEVIVVDDHSTDNTISVITKVGAMFHRKINIIELDKNQGIAKSRNMGIDQYSNYLTYISHLA